MWMAVTAGPRGLELGSKGATVHQALRWCYPGAFLMRAPRPSDYDCSRWYRWRWYLDPLWGEETGARLYRQKPGSARVRPCVPPMQWGHRPYRRLAYFEGLEAGGTRSHTVGVDWWGRVWDDDPACTPLPYPPRGCLLEVGRSGGTLPPPPGHRRVVGVGTDPGGGRLLCRGPARPRAPPPRAASRPCLGSRLRGTPARRELGGRRPAHGTGAGHWPPSPRRTLSAALTPSLRASSAGAADSATPRHTLTLPLPPPVLLPPPSCQQLEVWSPPLPPRPLLLSRCRGIHPHSGPMRVAVANTTSLQVHWPTLSD